MAFADLELDEMMSWPLGAQLIVATVLMLGALGVGLWLTGKPAWEDLQFYQQQEGQLKQELRIVAKQAALLPQMQQQYSDLSSHYQHLIEQLPAQKELASLLAAVNEQGLNNALTFTRIDWGKKQSQQFLYRLPLDIELTGSYNDIGRYTQAIAHLPRIVLIDNAEWQRVSQESSILHFRVMASTFQFKPSEVKEGGDGKN